MQQEEARNFNRELTTYLFRKNNAQFNINGPSVKASTTHTKRKNIKLWVPFGVNYNSLMYRRKMAFEEIEIIRKRQHKARINERLKPARLNSKRLNIHRSIDKISQIKSLSKIPTIVENESMTSSMNSCSEDSCLKIYRFFKSGFYWRCNWEKTSIKDC